MPASNSPAPGPARSRHMHVHDPVACAHMHVQTAAAVCIWIGHEPVGSAARVPDEAGARPALPTGLKDTPGRLHSTHVPMPCQHRKHSPGIATVPATPHECFYAGAPTPVTVAVTPSHVAPGQSSRQHVRGRRGRLGIAKRSARPKHVDRAGHWIVTTTSSHPAPAAVCCVLCVDCLCRRCGVYTGNTVMACPVGMFRRRRHTPQGMRHTGFRFSEVCTGSGGGVCSSAAVSRCAANVFGASKGQPLVSLRTSQCPHSGCSDDVRTVCRLGTVHLRDICR